MWPKAVRLPLPVFMVFLALDPDIVFSHSHPCSTSMAAPSLWSRHLPLSLLLLLLLLLPWQAYSDQQLPCNAQEGDSTAPVLCTLQPEQTYALPAEGFSGSTTIVNGKKGWFGIDSGLVLEALPVLNLGASHHLLKPGRCTVVGELHWGDEAGQMDIALDRYSPRNQESKIKVPQVHSQQWAGACHMLWLQGAR